MAVIAVLLERNPEVGFTRALDVQSMFLKALSYFKESTGSKASNEEELRGEFYQTPADGRNGTHSFIAKAVCSVLLDNAVTNTDREECSVM